MITRSKIVLFMLITGCKQVYNMLMNVSHCFPVVLSAWNHSKRASHRLSSFDKLALKSFLLSNYIFISLYISWYCYWNNSERKTNQSIKVDALKHPQSLDIAADDAMTLSLQSRLRSDVGLMEVNGAATLSTSSKSLKLALKATGNKCMKACVAIK